MPVIRLDLSDDINSRLTKLSKDMKVSKTDIVRLALLEMLPSLEKKFKIDATVCNITGHTSKQGD